MLRNKLKTQNSKLKTAIQNSKIFNFCLSFCILIFGFWIYLYAQEQFTYDAKGKRDPFIPLVTPDGRLVKLEQEEQAGGILLEGIIYDKNGMSYALVNANVVGIGEYVGDYRVLKIGKNKVIFIKDGEITEVELKKEEQ